MRRFGAGPLRHARSAQVVVVWAGAVGFFGCEGREHPTAEPDARQDKAALYLDDSTGRNAAAERLVAQGQPVVPLLDPFESGCIRSDSFPPYCRNFDRALGLTVTILGRIADAGRDSVNPAKNLLWRVLHAHTGDAFEDLIQRPEWQRTDADALRTRGTETLDRLMAISPDLTEKEVGARAATSARGAQYNWYLVSNCAGEAMYAGCNYGSFLFAPDGRRVSFRLIRWNEPDNFGTGFRLGLNFPAGVRSVGAVRAVGGFGGELERVTFYRLDDSQVPLCMLERAPAADDLLRQYARYVSIDARGCRVLRRDPRVRVRGLS